MISTNKTHTIRFSSTIITLAILTTIFFMGVSSAFTENAQTFNTTTFESARETFTLNMTTTGTITANFLFNNTRRTATISQVGPDTLVTGGLDMPLVSGTVAKNFTWEINFNNGTIVNSTSNQTNIQNSVFNLCGVGGADVSYINFTYKNETTAQENTTALISGSSFIWYLGSGTVNQTFTYTNAAEAASHAFCVGGPQDRTMNVDIDSYNYDNSESEQRTYSPRVLALTNTTTDTTLWLLPTNDGIFVTIQVINIADQPLSGVQLVFNRVGFGDITTVTTGASGTATIFLNPNFAYTLTATKTGFSDLTLSQTFSLTEYTITLGTAAGLATDYTRGIGLTVLPSPSTTISNNTLHSFNATLTSTLWDITSFGFVLFNSTGDSVGSGSTSGTGTVNVNYNPENDTLVSMNVFYVINGTYNNATYYWNVQRDEVGSVSGFFDRLSTYANQGVYGLTPFNLSLLGFVIVFLFMGILASKTSGIDQLDLIFFSGAILGLILFSFSIITSVVLMVVTLIFMVSIVFRRLRSI